MDNFDFESLSIRGYYLPANPHFMRLVSKENKANFEIKLVMLTLASCHLRQSANKPTRQQKELMFKFIRFVIEEFPLVATIRPALALFYEKHTEEAILDLGFVSQYDELCAQQFENIGEIVPLAQYSACMLASEPAKQINQVYRQLLWNLILDTPELLPANSSTYAMETLIFMDLLKGEQSSEYTDHTEYF